MMTRGGDRVDWTFDGTWPYEPKWFESEDGRMHYVDEGPRDGRPVIMVHGNPTWGYLFGTSSRRWSRPATARSFPTTSASGARTSPTSRICTGFRGTRGGSRPCSSHSISGGRQ